MLIITLLNEKGGVGKTTLAGILGAALALRGFRVLMIDADAQGDLTLSLGLAKAPHFYNFIKRPEASIKSLIRRVPEETCSGQLWAISGNGETAGLPFSSRVAEIAAALSRRFKQLGRSFDYIIIDTSPTPNSLHDAITVVTDWLILPTDAEAFSAENGLKSSLEHTRSNRADLLARGINKAQILAIVVNKYRNVSLHKVFLRRLVEQYGDLVWDAIPLRINLPESQAGRTFLMQSDPTEETNAHLWRFVERVIENMEEIHA